MKKLILLITLLIIGFGLAEAKRTKTDYKNPVRTDTVALLEMTNSHNKTVYRYMSVDVDKYGNYFITVNVNRFSDEGDDDIQIKVAGKDYKIKYRKTVMVYGYSYYPKVPSYTVTTTTIGNTTTTTVEPKLKDWSYFHSIYPISKELYDLIRNYGIEGIKVDGVPPIIVHKRY